MHTDDDLSRVEGGQLTNIRLSGIVYEDDSYDVKESQFLIISTTKGEFTVVNYNEHNGYYGGFAIRAIIESGSQE